MSRNLYIYMLASFIIVMNTTIVSNAQDPVKVERSNNKVVIEGSVYYVHVVKSGHTLYSIAKAYNVSEKEIVIENPGVTADLRIAQVLKIPANPASAFSVNTVDPEDGKNRHVLQSGETLYSISRLYECSVDMIIQLNPGLDIEDIPIGQIIVIPSGKDDKNDLSFDEEGFIFHKVKRRETLFSISRYYDVRISEIKAVNAEIGWGGPRAGQVIMIPKPNTTIDVFFRHDTIISDTVDLVFLDSLHIEEYNYDEIKDSYYSGQEVFNIAYLIPFNFSEQESLDSLLKDVKFPIRRERIIEQYELEEETPQAIQFLEFFEGSLLAINTLTDAGMELNVHFFDTRKSMFYTRKILALDEMAEMDLIIGPFYTYNLELVSEFCKENKIAVVTPFHADDSLTLDNPYLFQTTPSYKTEYRNNAKYLSRSCADNLIFVHNGDSSQIDRIEYYKKVLYNELQHYSALESVLFKEVIIQDGNMMDLVHALKSDVRNTVISPATDEAFASQLASTLFYRLDNFDIQLFGSPYWVGFDDIEISYIHKLQLTISHTHKYDFKDQNYLHLLKRFRENYFKEPSFNTRKGINFGMLGYDMSLYFLSALQQFGPGFILQLNDFHPAGMLSEYNFERLSPASGYENCHLKYYHFNQDMTVNEVPLPDMPSMHNYLQPAEEEEPLFKWLFDNRSDTIED